ncbi:MAG: molybdenum cofactor guanylyltransferase [Candidatus Bathyarchaeia archaeon]|jgi:molybdopterin-guanine dinucleotide biosynthesis protein A
MSLSAIIIAYNYSNPFKQDSGTLELNNKALIAHVVDAVNPLVDETLIVTDSQKHADDYAKLVDAKPTFVVEPQIAKNPLIATLAGFKNAHGALSLLVPYDAPFLSKAVLTLLFELCSGKSAVVPRNPDAQAEPLHAVYATQQALYAADRTIAAGKNDVLDLLETLQNIRYLSSLVIKQLDPDLKTFFRVKMPVDLKRATILSKKPKTQRRA